MARSGAPRTDRRSSEGIELFGEDDATDLIGSGTMTVPELLDPDVSLDIAAQLGASGQTVKVLYRSEEYGTSLVWSSFAPHYMLPRHSHSADCLYYVVRGEARLGNRVVAAGGGFFVPADAPYAYSAGPDGIEILEFRHAATFDMKITETAARFERILENIREHGPTWAELSPDG
jgi:quercetin dioxygenase-like cupin family protein